MKLLDVVLLTVFLALFSGWLLVENRLLTQCFTASIALVLSRIGVFIVAHTIENMNKEKPIILIGEKLDSFEKFFEDLKPILLAALKALPSEEELRSRIKKAVEEAIREAQ